MTQATPFLVKIDQQQIDDLHKRLSLTRFPVEETVNDWSQGVPLSYMEELVDYWQHQYDMRRLETRLNRYPQFTMNIDGLGIHYLHVRSPEPQARPLLITHGWPGSVVEFLKVIEPLTDPTAHHGDTADAFHVVCPSLPGYGFSGKPSHTGWGIEKIVEAWSTLMSRLGYDGYLAQGGDWGSGITTSLARFDTEHCKGIHLNLLNTWPGREQREKMTAEEKEFLAGFDYYKKWDSAYNWQQSTRPQTLGYSLADSPAGQLAWIMEKFHAWTDCDGHPENALSRDEMLDNVMLYWLTSTGVTSARLYWETRSTTPKWGDVQAPTGVSIFPRDTHRCSRRWAERTYKNIVYWNRLEKGGHFAAFEQPLLFVDELRNCFRAL